MNLRRLLIISTLALMLAFAAAGSGDNVKHFREALGAASDEEIYEALYDGKSLAEIAEANDADVNEVIELQIAEMTDLLDSRFAEGHLTLQQYEAQKKELPDIITRSVYGKV